MIELLRILAYVIVAVIVALLIYYVLTFIPGLPQGVRALLGLLVAVVCLIVIFQRLGNGKGPI